MTERLPEPDEQISGEGIPDTADDASPERDRLVDPEEPALPAEDPVAVTDFGTTADEQLHGESIDGKLAREEPEPREDPLRPRDVDEPSDEPVYADGADDLDPSERQAGQLVESDEGARPDTEKEVVAHDAGRGIGGISAEEAAMHVEPEGGAESPNWRQT
ncbi:DUF5709 domain-containing protein [soil metagenome]